MEIKKSKLLRHSVVSGIALILSCVFLLAFKKSEPNYRVAKAISISHIKTSGLLKTNFIASGYVKTCPDGSQGCGATSGIGCAYEKDCQPSQTPSYRRYPCNNPNYPNSYGCQTSVSNTPQCPDAAVCPPGSDPSRNNHPSPCTYANPAFGCFAGAPIGGGPGCSPLVNCQNPPD